MRAVFRPVEANAVTFVALYVLGVVTAWLTVPNTPSGKLYDNLYLELFLDLYLLCVVLYLFGARGATTRPSNKKRKGWRWASVIKFLVCFVLYAVALADVYCFEKYGSSLTPSMLMLVGETDSREAGERLGGHADRRNRPDRGRQKRTDRDGRENGREIVLRNER